MSRHRGIKGLIEESYCDDYDDHEGAEEWDEDYNVGIIEGNYFEKEEIFTLNIQILFSF